MHLAQPPSGAAGRIAFALLGFSAALGTWSAGIAVGQAASDRGGAIVVFPYVVVDTTAGTETTLHLSNGGTEDVAVRCFYEDAPRTCSDAPGQTCASDADCTNGTCDQGRTIIDFSIELSAGQPFGWRASAGDSVGSAGAGSAPPLGSGPFIGSLRCLALGVASGSPVDGILEGAATLARRAGSSTDLDLARYNALTLASVTADDDGELMLGGDAAEYEGCPGRWIWSHASDGAVDPNSSSDTVNAHLVPLPCSADFATLQTERIIVHYNVFNEFGQRVGTSTRLAVQQVASLPEIHPVLFDAAVQGSFATHTSILTVGGGVLAIGFTEHHRNDTEGRVFSAATDLTFNGVRPTGDRIVLPLLP